jgi:hypothetical protein
MMFFVEGWILKNKFELIYTCHIFLCLVNGFALISCDLISIELIIAYIRLLQLGGI